jgi:hypothetical protein
MSDVGLLAWLRTPEAVRERCNDLLALAEQDSLPHFVFDPGRLDDVVNYVAAVIRQNYPDLAIPYHSRWRHFEVNGLDQWAPLAVVSRDDPIERARQRIELCTVSVLLDAGAGSAWRYREPGTGLLLTRSEGLAIASLHAFRDALFSSDPRQKLRADAAALARLSGAALAAAFQVAADNPLAGFAGRAALLRRLGVALQQRGAERIGGLLDLWLDRAAANGVLPARDLLSTILKVLAPIWPDRLVLAGERLGDVWHHPLLRGEGLVPFHKLSQWLCYSLIEVLEEIPVAVTGLDDLTGLAEYRNGGLFIDLGVLALRDPSVAAAPLPAGHPAIVEWRALTVALLDRIAPKLRVRLGASAAQLPLARLLQGGTWDAGRRIARERRADGGPPLVVQSDGTVF